jgi:hypothetical protein
VLTITDDTRAKFNATVSEQEQIEAYQEQSNIRAQAYSKELESLRQEYNRSKELYYDAVEHQSRMSYPLLCILSS